MEYFGSVVKSAAIVTALADASEILIRRPTYRLIKPYSAYLGNPYIYDVSTNKNEFAAQSKRKGREASEDQESKPSEEKPEDLNQPLLSSEDADLEKGEDELLKASLSAEPDFKNRRIYQVISQEMHSAMSSKLGVLIHNSSMKSLQSSSRSTNSDSTTIVDINSSSGAHLLSKLSTQTMQHHWLISYDDLRLEKKIGQGSFGEVYKAKWKGNDVAVKIFFRQQSHDNILLELRKESAIMSELRHPNILMFLGACMTLPNLCIVTEYMQNGCIGKFIRNKKNILSYSQRVKMATQVSHGMDYLHSFHPPLIHRDLSSYNIE